MLYIKYKKRGERRYRVVLFLHGVADGNPPDKLLGGAGNEDMNKL